MHATTETPKIGRQHYSLLLLMALVLIVYSPICRHEFVAMDDEINIYQNSSVTDFTPANLLQFWERPYAGMYIPITYNLWSVQAKLASYFSNAAEANLNPFVFHATNFLLHLANSIIVLFILRLLLKNDWASVAGALVFALHPAQMEPVAWVTGFKDLLSGFWSLLAVWQYILYTRSAAQDHKRRLHYALATTSFLFALLSKPGAVSLPLIVGALGALLLNRTVRQLAVDLAPWAILALPIVLLTKFSQPDVEIPFLPNLGQRFLIAGDALSFYLYKLVLPFSMGPDYGRSPQFVLSQDWIYLTGLAPYLAAIVVLWKRPKPWFMVASIILGALLPVLGFMPFAFQEISTVADRYLYTALLGPAYGIGWLLCRYNTRPLWLLLAAAVLGLSAKTASQARHWQNFLTLYNHAIAVNPSSWISYHNLGVEQHKRHQLESAIKLYAETIKINPNYATAFENLAKAVQYAAISRPEAIFPASDKPDGAPTDYGAAYYRLGNLCREIQAQKEALTLYEKALEVTPGFAKAYLSVGDIYKEIGVNEKAIGAYQKALEFDPTLVEAYNNLGLLYIDLNREDEAHQLLTKAIALNPSQAEPYNNLGILKARIGRTDEALAAFTKAVETDPSYGPAFSNLSMLYWQKKDYQKAIESADRALALGHSLDPAYLETLNAYRGQ